MASLLSKNSKVILTLPTTGSPFLWRNKIFNTKDKAGKTELSENIRKVVRGDVQQADLSSLRIHPMFDNRWRIVDALLRCEDAEVFVNEEGTYKCSPNMACLRLERDMSSFTGPISMERFMSLPLKVCKAPFFGDIAVVIPYKAFKGIADPESLKLVRVEDHYEDMGLPKPEEPSDDSDYERCLGGYIYEPYDGEDSKKFKTYVKSKGWFIDSFGQVFKKPTGRGDEKESTDYDSDKDDEE